jgi:RNA polymerase sigma factor (TIGR02999 family)
MPRPGAGDMFRLVMSDVTGWLEQARGGDVAALDRIFEALYPELHRIARARAQAGERTLTPTVLINEAYLRLLGANSVLTLHDRRHFLACAARAMRGVIIDHARRRSAAKRGGPGDDIALDAAAFELGEATDAELLALDDALHALERIDPQLREIVELRFFAGYEFEHISEVFDCSLRTAKRHWERARAFLHARLVEG